MDKDRLIGEMMSRETLRKYIPQDRCQEFGDFAWEKGQSAARALLAANPGRTSAEIARKMGLSVKDEEGLRFFYSEYNTKSRLIVLFKNVIMTRFIEPERETLLSTDYERVRLLFLAHEMFHHLECSDPAIGKTHTQRKVTVFAYGPVRLTSGLRCLSEIAAHSFALHLAGKGIVY